VGLALALSLVIAAGSSPGRAAKFASPGFSVINIEPKLAEFYTEHVAQQVKLTGVEIITVREIQSLLGMERQKALLGCTEEASSCVAELASALGADGVLLGDIARLGARYTINLKVIGAQNGRTLAVFSDSASSEDEVIDALTRGARKLVVDASAALGRAPPRLPTLEAPRPPLRKIAIAPLALGVVAAGAGAVLLGLSEVDYQALKTGKPGADGATVAARGQTFGTLGVAGLVVGGVALAGAATLFFLGAEPPVTVAVGPAGGMVMVQGTFP
jgi:hypothetical protein